MAAWFSINEKEIFTKRIHAFELALVMVILFHSSASALASTFIERWNGSSWITVPETEYSISGSPPVITFGNNATWGKYRIYTSPLENLLRIDVSQISTAGTNQYVWVFIGKPNQALPTSEPLLDAQNPIAAGAVDWRGLVAVSGQVVRVQAHISGDLLGSVTAINVYRLDIDGDVAAPINNIGAESDALKAVRVVGSITIEGNIISHNGKIELVDANGPIDGDVINLNGAIGVVRSREGFIGNDPNRNPYLAIKAMKPSGSTVAHAGEIDAVIADEQGMRVDVTAATGIKQLLSGHPTFGAKGSLTAARLLDADPDTGIGGVINVRGPCRLTTIFSDGIPALGRILVGRLGRIGDNNNVTDYGNTMITIGNEVTGGIGLQGRIVVDAYNQQPADNNSNPTAWSAKVKIERPGTANDILLGPSSATPDDFAGFTGDYAALSSQLGGGTIGLNRFRLHGTDSLASFTQSGVTQAVTETDPNTMFYKLARVGNESVSLTVKYHGKLVPPLGATPVIVEERPCNGSWADITSSFTFGSVTDRTITLSASAYTFPLDYEYRVRPRLDGAASLRGDLATIDPMSGTPNIVAVSASDDYRFYVAQCPRADTNADGAVNTVDLVRLLGRFGLTVSGCTADADFNHDNAVNTLDLTILLGNFGVTCAGNQLFLPAESGSAGGVAKSVAPQDGLAVAASAASSSATASSAGTPPGPVLAELGFTTAEAY